MTKITHSSHSYKTTMSKQWWLGSVFIFALLSLTHAQATIQPQAITPEAGKEYYTRYNFWHEKKKHKTTNYSRGVLVPVNTKVTLLSIGKKKIKLEIEGQPVTLVNAKKHTQRGTDEIAAELLSLTEISLSEVNQELLDDMKNGVLRLGMTKEEVLITRGYPPRHKTPSTKANRWVYWNNRFVQHTLVFRDDKLAEGRELF